MNWLRRHPRTAVFIASFLIALAFDVPQGLHTMAMKTEVEACRQEVAAALKSDASHHEAVAWLQQHQYSVWGSATGSGFTQPIMAERALSDGNVFWRPATAQLYLYLKPTKVQGELWIFPPARVALHSYWGIIPKVASSLPLV